MSTEPTAIQFTGTYNSCDEITTFLGGPHATSHQWKSVTVEGGYVLSPDPVEFRPGDWIIRDETRVIVTREVTQ